MTIDQTYDDFLTMMKQDEAVQAVILTGSYAKGFQTSSSDIDVYIIVAPGTSADYLAAIKYRVNELTHKKVDLSNNAVQSLDDFEQFAAIGSEFEWERYNLLHAIIEVDKTDGKINEILSTKATLNTFEAQAVITEYLGPYLNLSYRSVASSLKGTNTAAQLDAAQAVKSLISCLFAFKQRVAPYNKYLQWELQKYPLGYDNDADLFHMITQFAHGNVTAHRTLFKLVKQTAQSSGAQKLYDAWGNKLDIMSPDFKAS